MKITLEKIFDLTKQNKTNIDNVYKITQENKTSINEVYKITQENKKGILLNKEAIEGNKKEIQKNRKLIERNMSILFKHDQRLNNIEEKVALIPKLYDNVDKILKEVIDNRQERTFMIKRIRRLEKIHGIQY